MSRRGFLEIMGAALAMAGMEGCSTRQPEETILPYNRGPEGLLPGKPQYYATGMDVMGEAVGLLVKSDMGRPIKVDGNPDHPASLGGSDAFAQASLLGLYDPDRSRSVLRNGEASEWDVFARELGAHSVSWSKHGGRGLRILTGKIASPSLLASLGEISRRYPQARWHAYDPLESGHAARGAGMAFGRELRILPHFDRARVIVSLDSDFLGWAPGHIRYSRDFASRRDPDSETGMSRLYVVESCLSLTGANADRRIALAPAQIPLWALALAQALGIVGADETAGMGRMGESGADPWLGWEEIRSTAEAVAGDLRSHPGSALVWAGESQPPWVHALTHDVNEHLGSLGNTVTQVIPGREEGVPDPRPLLELARDMRAGEVEALLILDGNPAYAAPADLDFAESLRRVPLAVHWGSYRDETAALCRWHIPAAHYLESWGDLASLDGTATLVQPLIAPLYFAKTAQEMLSALAGDFQAKGYDALKNYWRRRLPQDGFDAAWDRALRTGLVENTAFPQTYHRPQPFWRHELKRVTPFPPMRSDSVQVAFLPDPTVGDGRYAENAWLQELPKPLSKLTWENAIHLSPDMAESLGVVDGDELELRSGGRTVAGPAWILPGHADGVVTLTLGYGRQVGGKVAAQRGYNAFLVRDSTWPWWASDAKVGKTGKRSPVACTQDHQRLEGRDLVKHADLREWRKGDTPSPPPSRPPSLFPALAKGAHAWGMTIDLSLCTGCSACVIACQAENNIPVVGREQVMAGREMHWMRIDLYFQEIAGERRALFEPLLCMHCENAPCEVVCPVAATLHSPEGLNEMVYNRCIGTRYCSNNCPYKVRRFNFLQFSDRHSESLKAMRNPDVTVRSRGVMEKCSYCVQRIERARIDAGMEGRAMRDGDVITACQQACPAGAIVFGDLLDAKSKVAIQARRKRNDVLLRELNTLPRTTYLLKVSNAGDAMRGRHG